MINGYDLARSANLLLLKAVTVHGIRVGHRRALEELVRAVDVLKLKLLTDLPAARDHLNRDAVGKIVVELI